MSSDPHASPIKTPRQLITVVVLAFVVPVLLIILLVTFVTGQKVGGAGTEAMTPEAIAERLRPVGTVAFAGTPSGPRTLQTGEAVYKLACGACHAAGVAGAPKAGDSAAWAPRLKQGYDTLVKHAVEGFKGMPAKGGNAALDPIEVARAVVYIANQAGAKFKEPEAPAATAKAACTHRRADRPGDLRQVPHRRPERRAEDRRPRGLDQACLHWDRCRGRLGDQRPRQHAVARRYVRSDRCRTQVGRAVHVQPLDWRAGSGGGSGSRRCGARRDKARWREGLCDGLQCLPRGRRRRCAEVR